MIVTKAASLALGLIGVVFAAAAADGPFAVQPLTLDAAPQSATAPSESDENLAMELANPVADLVSVPFQFNYDEGYGPKDAGIWKLNVQPVIPFTLNDDWNLITRTIVPVIYQESLATGFDSNFGLGDTVQSFFFSPKKPTSSGWIWGAGPVFSWPTATDIALGSGQWGAGPTFVGLRQTDGWTYGILVNHLWSFAGDDDRSDLNVSFVQPFLSYTFDTATTLTVQTETTYNWDSHDWTVPINVLAGQLVRVGKLPVSFALGGRWYAESPDGGPEWGVRFVTTILLPKL